MPAKALMEQELLTRRSCSSPSTQGAIQYYQEILQLSSMPLLIGHTPEDIESAIKEQRVTCTPEDQKMIKSAFVALAEFTTETVKLSKGSVHITKVVSIKPGSDPRS